MKPTLLIYIVKLQTLTELSELCRSALQTLNIEIFLLEICLKAAG